MSIKVHYLASHLDHFTANLGDFSDEQDERFHQDIKDFEVRYQGRWDITIIQYNENKNRKNKTYSRNCFLIQFQILCANFRKIEWKIKNVLSLIPFL